MKIWKTLKCFEIYLLLQSVMRSYKHSSSFIHLVVVLLLSQNMTRAEVKEKVAKEGYGKILLK